MTLQIRKQMLKVEMDNTIAQVRILQSEIDLREKQIKDLLRKYSDLQTLRQGIDDELLEKEYNALVAQNI